MSDDDALLDDALLDEARFLARALHKTRFAVVYAGREIDAFDLVARLIARLEGRAGRGSGSGEA